MRCWACHAEIPPELTDVFQCPGCGRPLRRWLLDRAEGLPALPALPGLWKWLPGVVLSLVLAVADWALLIRGYSEISMGLVVGIPTCFGALVGYTTRVRGYFKPLAVAVVGLIALMLLGVALRLTGLYCAAILLCVAILPVVLGVGLGVLLRRVVGSRILPIVLLALLPPTVGGLEKWLRPPPDEVETVVSESRIDAPVDVVWSHLMFFEEVGGDPPWMFRLGLPRPIRARGSKANVGDEEICEYSRGTLRKRITERVEGRRLAFEVLEQHVHFEHDVRVVGGAFDLEPDSAGGTRLRLTSRWVGLAHPRFVWSPLEVWSLHAIHDFVIDAIRAKSGTPSPSSSEATLPGR